ncbi:MAG: very short patch repair endonuclease [Prolixibacteraceae bacterium]|nr:very short patch repair endonuclease [Prolixibacteraceae bacterium]
MKNYPDNQIIVPRFNEDNGFYTTKERSKLMSKIKGVDTKPELKLKKALWRLGYRYRKNVKQLPGKPDIVYKKYKLVVFVDGEFWHGYEWEDKKQKIKSNRDFWIPKIERNIQRDQFNNQLLADSGWTVLRFWEKEIKMNLEHCLNRIIDHIRNF